MVRACMRRDTAHKVTCMSFVYSPALRHFVAQVVASQTDGKRTCDVLLRGFARVCQLVLLLRENVHPLRVFS